MSGGIQHAGPPGLSGRCQFIQRTHPLLLNRIDLASERLRRHLWLHGACECQSLLQQGSCRSISRIDLGKCRLFSRRQPQGQKLCTAGPIAFDQVLHAPEIVLHGIDLRGQRNVADGVYPPHDVQLQLRRKIALDRADVHKLCDVAFDFSQAEDTRPDDGEQADENDTKCTTNLRRNRGMT